MRSEAILRTDKRGRPFVWCPSCLSRSFLGSDIALTAIRTMSPDTLEALYRSLHNSLEHREQQAPSTSEQEVQEVRRVG